MEDVERYSSEIIERIGLFFEMCLSLGAVPTDLLEQRLAWSETFEALERGDPRDLLNGTVGDLYRRVFRSVDIPNQYLRDSRCYWIGESYARIFLTRRVSFSRSMLLMPVSEMKDLFLPYHEMDPERIVELYDKREKQSSVLECLKRKRRVTYVEIVKRTGISKPTLFRMKDNAVLDRIGLKEASRLSFVLSCPVRCFLVALTKD